MKVAIYIGRFQPLHNGHIKVIEHALMNYDKLVIVFGSADEPRTIKNPFTTQEREIMIRGYIESINQGEKVCFTSILDYPHDDEAWVKNTTKKIQETLLINGFPLDCQCTIVGSNRDASTWYLNSFTMFHGVDVVEPFVDEQNQNVNATEIRALWFGGELPKQVSSKLPAATVIAMTHMMAANKTAFENLVEEYNYYKSYKESWANTPYPPTFVTADIAVIHEHNILVIRRGQCPGKGLYALPGGFVDKDETVMEAAYRELREETGLALCPSDVYHTSTKIIDAPNRSFRGRVISILQVVVLEPSKPRPSVSGQNAPENETNGESLVETTDAIWMPFNVALKNRNIWFDDHYHIIHACDKIPR